MNRTAWDLALSWWRITTYRFTTLSFFATVEGNIIVLIRWLDCLMNYFKHIPSHTQQNILGRKFLFQHWWKRLGNLTHSLSRLSLRYITYFLSLVTIRVMNGSFLYRVNKETQITIRWCRWSVVRRCESLWTNFLVKTDASNRLLSDELWRLQLILAKVQTIFHGMITNLFSNKSMTSSSCLISTTSVSYLNFRIHRRLMVSWITSSP